MVKSHVKVFVRKRPTNSAIPGLKFSSDGKSCVITTKASSGVGTVDRDAVHQFKFDGILEGASQDTVYDQVASEIVENVIAGYNGTVFCYGQTGAGKTYTMSGSPSAFVHRGIIPRAISHVFREVDMRVEKQFTIRISYLEIYNDALYDLLSDSPPGTVALHVVTEGGVTTVRGLTQHEVRGEEDALAAFFRGEAMRSTAEHVLNKESSRSHCVFTIHVEATNAGGHQERAVQSKINLVDLAGSERTKKTGVGGQTLVEASYINKSLTFLEQVVQALVKRSAHVPFRQSKLTAVLRDALGGNNKAAMVANVWPEVANLEETLSTLRFASRVRLLENDAVVNESSDPAFVIRKQERVIRELRQELAMRDTLAGRGVVAYDDMSDADVAELQALVRRFLEGDAEESDLPTDTLKRIKECYRQFRNVFMSVQGELEARVLQAQRSVAAVELERKRTEHPGGQAAAATGTVGDVDMSETMGFHVGTAPLHARPATHAMETPGRARTGQSSRPQSGRGGGSPGARTAVSGGRPSANEGDDAGAGREEAFYRFKHEEPEGIELHAAARSAQESYARARAELRRLVAVVNECKREMDAEQAKVAERRREGAPADVVDEEEWAALGRVRELKGQYRGLFAEVKEARARAEAAAESLAAARQALVARFQDWHAAGEGDVSPRGGFLDGAEDGGEEGEEGDGEGTGAFRTAARQLRVGRASPRKYGGPRAVAEATRKQEQQMRAMAIA